ncbi:MAG: AMP-binding protein [Xanthomonadaceae bacterium]|nr:AMP-binding protein [Xanthomonadaceae bacterium]
MSAASIETGEFLPSAPHSDARIVALTAAGAVTALEFRQQVAAWASLLESHEGERVLLFHHDSLVFAAALLGAWHAGKRVVLPGDVLPATLARALPYCDIRVGSVPGALSAPAPAPPVRRKWKVLDPQSTRLTLFTSGSSGEPVAIAKTLRQLQAELRALEARFGEAMGDAAVYGTVSHQHIYGLLFRVLWPLTSGRPFHAQILQSPEQIAALPGSHALALISSPAHLKRLPEGLNWLGLRDRLRRVFSSGGPLPASACAAVERLWSCTPTEVFGSTETGGIASREGHAQAWSPLPGVHWRIADGHLEIRSPHLPDEAWQRTSDRVEATADGFHLLGRADRIAKIEERRVSLDAIEQALIASGLLAEARVTVLHGPRASVAAAVVPNREGAISLQRDGKRALASRLRAHLAGSVDAIAMPRRWRFVDSLPGDAQGKTSEALLADLFRPRIPPCRWLERSAAVATAELTVTLDLAVFDGHFPALAVLPGVAMVDWAIRLGGEVFALPANFAKMEVLKFQSLARPGAELHLRLDWNAAAATLGFRYTSSTGTHASGRLLFAGATP